MIERVKTWAGVAGFISLLAGCSYLEEAPKYRWQEQVEAEAAQRPYLRKIAGPKVIKLESPASWFRPSVESLTYAAPDTLEHNTFYVVRNEFDGDEPTFSLYEVDCDDGTLYRASSKEKDGPTHRDFLGEVTSDPRGRPYRYVTEEPERLTASERKTFCADDWHREREALIRSHASTAH